MSASSHHVADAPLTSTEIIARWDVDLSRKDGRSVHSKLCGECIAVFRRLIASEVIRDRTTLPILRSLDRSRCTLILWADAFKVVDGGLDSVVATSRYLRRRVLQLLSSIAASLSARLLPKLRVIDEFESERLDELRLEAEAFIHERYEDRNEHEEFSDSDASDSDTSVLSELDDVVESLETDTHLLMELDRFIHVSTIAGQMTPEISRKVAPWRPQDAFAQIIRVRFPDANDKLVESLARANLERMQRCHEIREMHANEPTTEEAVGDLMPKGEATTRDSGYGTMSHISGTVANKHPLNSYAETVMSYAAGDRTVKIPPLSVEAKQGKPFECLACSKQVRFTSSRMWKRHLFSDLRPWTCVEPLCEAAITTFDTREAWLQHLEFDHEYGPEWETRKCSLCNEQTGNGVDDCSKHLLTHIEEISLAALPRTADEDNQPCHSETTSSGATPEWNFQPVTEAARAEVLRNILPEQELPSDAELAYPCGEAGCSMRFDQRYKLNHHKRYHMDTHKCDYPDCGKEFETVIALKRHIDDGHKLKMTYYCTKPNCEYSRHGDLRFNVELVWRSHMKRIHHIARDQLDVPDIGVQGRSGVPRAMFEDNSLEARASVSPSGLSNSTSNLLSTKQADTAGGQPVQTADERTWTPDNRIQLDDSEDKAPESTLWRPFIVDSLGQKFLRMLKSEEIDSLPCLNSTEKSNAKLELQRLEALRNEQRPIKENISAQIYSLCSELHKKIEDRQRNQAAPSEGSVPSMVTLSDASAQPSQPAREYAAHGTSSAFSNSANLDEDWAQVSDMAERRRISNRIAQRNYRKKLKSRLEDLERRAGSSDEAETEQEPQPASKNTKSHSPSKSQAKTHPAAQHATPASFPEGSVPEKDITVARLSENMLFPRQRLDLKTPSGRWKCPFAECEYHNDGVLFELELSDHLAIAHGNTAIPNFVPDNRASLNDGTRHADALPLEMDARSPAQLGASTGDFDKSSLSPHSQQLSQESPDLSQEHKCFFCVKVFRRSEHLKRHMRTHTQDKPFVCTFPGCGAMFSRRDNHTRHLHARHLRAHSKKPESVQENLGLHCVVESCGYTPNDMEALREHVSREHKDHRVGFGLDNEGRPVSMFSLEVPVDGAAVKAPFQPDLKRFTFSPATITLERVYRAAEIEGLNYLDAWEKRDASLALRKLESELLQQEPERSKVNAEIYDICLGLNRTRRERQRELASIHEADIRNSEPMELPW